MSNIHRGYLHIFITYSLNALRLAFLNTHDLPFSHSLNIEKMRARVGQKNNHALYFMISCTNRGAIFKASIFKKQRIFFLSKYFLNNLLLIVFFQNMVSKFVNVLQQKMNKSLLEETQANLCAPVCQKLCAKFRVDCRSCFCTVAHQMLSNQKSFLSQIPLTIKIATSNTLG